MMKRASALILVGGLLIGASACGSDEKAKDAPVQNDATDGPTVDSGDQDDAPGLDAAVDAIGVEGVADAMVTAMGAERYELQGEQLHLYLSQDGRITDSMSACIVAGSLIDEGDAVVVIHDDAGETTC